MGNIHVANGSSRTVRARACQEKIHVKEIDATGNLSFPFKLDASVKVQLEHSLDDLSFARIGPGESLEFDLKAILGGEEYITIVTADEETPTVICYNYNPPGGRSVIITDNNSVQLSQRKGDMWKTDNGICYGGSCLVDKDGKPVQRKAPTGGSSGGVISPASGPTIPASPPPKSSNLKVSCRIC